MERALEDHKAADVVVIDLAGKTSVADVMVIASGTSHRHVAALADHLQQALKAAGTAYLSSEGTEQADWVLIDAGDLIVHLFRPEVRAFYALERMWAPALPGAAAAGQASGHAGLNA